MLGTLGVWLLLAGPIAEAERLASAALREADPKASLALAQRALLGSAEFDATAFVRAGRKGEVVEDAFQESLRAYRRHRALVYQAVGAAHAAGGAHQVAERYLRRALLLEPDRARVVRLCRELIALGRGSAALDLDRKSVV